MYGLWPIFCLVMMNINNTVSYSEVTVGNYLYKFKPKNRYIKLTLVIVSAVYAICYVIEIINEGKSILFIIAYIAIVCAMVVLAILFLFFKQHEGITEKGILLSSGFLKWESIIDFSWKAHFTKKNIYLNLRLNNANNMIGDRFVAVSKKDKDETDRLLTKQLEKNKAEDKSIDSPES